MCEPRPSAKKKCTKEQKKVDKNKTEEISIELNEVVLYQIGSSLDATTL
jgi:hypothetical protein